MGVFCLFVCFLQLSRFKWNHFKAPGWSCEAPVLLIVPLLGVPCWKERKTYICPQRMIKEVSWRELSWVFWRFFTQWRALILPVFETSGNDISYIKFKTLIVYPVLPQGLKIEIWGLIFHFSFFMVKSVCLELTRPYCTKDIIEKVSVVHSVVPLSISQVKIQGYHCVTFGDQQSRGHPSCWEPSTKLLGLPRTASMRERWYSENIVKSLCLLLAVESGKVHGLLSLRWPFGKIWVTTFTS